jgi:hypothetical protein
MLEITERTERVSARAQDETSVTATSHRQALQAIRSKRTRAIWMLSGLGLIPLAALVLSPERWHELPHGVQWAAYLASLILFTAACSLIVNPDDVHASGYKQDSAESRKRRKHRRLLHDGSARGA